MNTNATVLNAKSFICIAALEACAALSAPVHADDHEVTVRISVRTAGLDLSQPADAREVYRRLYFAARTACGNGNRVGLQPPASFVACYEKALGDAVGSVNRPQRNTVCLACTTSRTAETSAGAIPVPRCDQEV